MAERLDVAGRFAEGVAAIEHTQTYVRACGDPTPVRDIYDSEDGLDLRALDADCTRLRAVGAAALDTLRLQRDQLAALASSWTGPGADAADAFLQRHCNTANTVVSEIRAAAQRCEALRDNLWQLVDAKVATAVAIDDRTTAQRPGWLAAAAAGDREVIGQQIKPYVDNDIRRDWVSAMESGRTAITDAYDMVTDRLAGAPRAYFEIPGDLGPAGPPVPPVGSRAPMVDVTAAPAPAARSATPSVAAEAPSVVPNMPLAQPDWGTGLGAVSGVPGGSSGLGGGGDPGGLGGLGGLASRIVDGMGGLLDPPADATAQDPFDEVDRAEDRAGSKDDEAKDHLAKDDEAKDDEAKDDKAKDHEADEPVEPTTETATKPSLAAPPAGPVPAAASVVAPVGTPPPAPGSTPCEIAADELPKAGQ